jgi:hypothetical protein
VSNEDFRRELNQVFDDVSGSPSSSLRDRVRSSVATAPEARGPYWIAAVAACLIAVLIVGVLLINGPLKRPTSIAGPQSSPAASPSPFLSQTPTASPSASASATPFACTANDFVFKQTTPAQPTPPVAFISALRTGTHGTYDRVTIEFVNGIPHDIQVSAPGSTTFTQSPSGQTATVKGEHGILVVIHGADLHSSYNGSIDIVTGYATLAEVKRVEDFEGVVQLGLGVNGSGCYRAFWLSNPDRLVIDIQSAA